MNITEHENYIELSGTEDFSARLIFDCGQCFRWDEQPDGSYLGVAGGRAARVRSEDGRVYISGKRADYDAFWHDYFDMGLDYAAIRKLVSIDDYMSAASDYGAGIRILRQDKWETLCSFIISQCNNITRIKGIISRFCELFGEPIEFEGKTFYDFPTAERTAALTAEDLAPLRSGYRAPYIIAAAKRVVSGEADLNEIAKLSESDALAELKHFEGVGPKVANCVLLFGLHRLDAFPMDVWIKRVVSEVYGKGFDPAVFSGWAGVAQQYMFHYARTKGAESA